MFARRLRTLRQLISLLRKHVPLSGKALFFLALAYLLWPIDLLPDVALVAGWIDDVIVLFGVGTWIWNRLPKEQQTKMKHLLGGNSPS